MSDTILLLNPSNYSENLVYPYAFIQISAIAAKYGIDILRKDLFGIENWKVELVKIIEENKFQSIFVTIRNTDTLGIHEYPSKELPFDKEKEYYFPLVLTQELIKILREITEIPVVVGGFGFSVIPEKALQFVGADFGVFGGPDGLLKEFQSFLNGISLEKIPNLYYYGSGAILSGPRQFYPPFNGPEYTLEIIKEIKEFKSKHAEGENNSLVQTVAVEISRGCPYRCSFCCEPVVRGNKIQYRKFDPILEDVRLLRDNGFSEIFFVCSELNPHGNDFALQLAEEMRKLNSEVSDDKKIKWLATYLMNFSITDFKKLKEAGFYGGWYDIVSLEDKNLKAIHAPYTSVEILDIVKKLDGGLHGAFIGEDKIPDLTERIYTNKPKTHTGSFFLGNPKATISTIRETLKIANEYGLETIYDKTSINYATRIFNYVNLTDHELRSTYSVDFDGQLGSYDDLYPSFTYPPDLLDHFENPDKLTDFFTYVQTTFLSSEFLFEINWIEFLRINIDHSVFFQLWEELDKTKLAEKIIVNIPDIQLFLQNLSPEQIENLYTEETQIDELNKFSLGLNVAIQMILIDNNEKLDSTTKFLKLPHSEVSIFKLSPYEIMNKFYTTFSKLEEILEYKRSLQEGSLEKLFVDYLWSFKNIRLEEELKPFFR